MDIKAVVGKKQQAAVVGSTTAAAACCFFPTMHLRYLWHAYSTYL